MKQFFLFFLLCFVLLVGIAIAQNEPIPIAYGESIEGEISDDDFEQEYIFAGTEGDVVTITMAKSDGDLDSFLRLLDADGEQISQNDDSTGSAAYRYDSRIFNFQLPETGDYLIVASRYSGEEGESTGTYTLTLEGGAAGTTEFPIVQIDTPAGLVNLVEVVLDDRYPFGCDPNVNYSCFAVAPAGLEILFLFLSADPGDVLNLPIYVTEPDNSTRHYLELAGVDSGRGLVAFAVPDRADNFILYWPGNEPIALDDDEDGVWIYEDACPDEEGVSVAHGCPDPDSDGDEVSDSRDNCPDVVGSVGADGCPDADEDTVADADDTCPDLAGSPNAAGCPDSDNDRVADSEDNCPDDRNSSQTDFNADGTGDVCQDSDEDTFLDAADNCPEEIGTLAGCPDTDEDSVADANDSCPNEAGSRTADGCPDTDEDTIADSEDNCPDDRNSSQTDFNADGTGDACQDSDEDTFLDAADNCPEEAGTLEGCLDTDADELADLDDACPNEAGSLTADGCPDADGDTTADAEDNCPDVRNNNQADFNHDNIGDMCQDSDEDSFMDAADNCPEEAGTLEGCPDSDEDGVEDEDDECPDEAGLPEMNGCLFTAVVIAGSGNVNLREGPGTGFAIVGTAAPDDELQILGRNEEGDWLRVRTLPDEEGGEVVEAWIAVWLVQTDATIEDLPIIEP